MVQLDRLLGIAGMGTAVANVAILRRFLSHVMVVVALTAIGGTMAGMILIGLFCGFYVVLVHYGTDPLIAVLIVAALALAALGTVASLAVMRWRQLKSIAYTAELHSPMLSKAREVADSFLDGLFGHHASRYR